MSHQDLKIRLAGNKVKRLRGRQSTVKSFAQMQDKFRAHSVKKYLDTVSPRLSNAYKSDRSHLSQASSASRENNILMFSDMKKRLTLKSMAKAASLS
jgi:hypothetical protein